MERPFCQVDVFADELYLGNPVAVVLDGKGLSHRGDAAFRVLDEPVGDDVRPAAGSRRGRLPGADLHAQPELPFAGHPTLGTCHAWLAGGGTPQRGDVVVQECDAGLIELRRIDGALAFAAPPLLRSGPVDDETRRRIVSVLGIDRADIVDAQWVDNGPGWVGVLLDSADAVLALRPGRPTSTSAWPGPTRRARRRRSRFAPSPRPWAGSARIR